MSSAVMLVAREAWTRVGPPDERLRPCHADLDFCWRVRVAGLRVVLDPTAVAYHLGVGDEGRREGARPERRRYFEERSTLTSILKNYRLVTLLWVLPLFLLQGIARLLLLLAARRFSDAGHVAAAWGWAAMRAPGTIRRRLRAQSVRRVRDRELTRLMAPAFTRLRRWAGQASTALFPRRAERRRLDETEEVELVSLSERIGGLLSTHPGAVALTVGVLLALVAFRDVVFASPLEGGSLPTFPDSATEMMKRFSDETSPGGFGAPGGASPALIPLALGSLLTLGNPRTLSWVIVASAPLLAGLSAYRAVARRTGERGAGVAAGAAYGLSAVTLWAVSEGAVGEMAFLVGLPWLAMRVADPYDGAVRGPARWLVGTGFGLALIGSFFPEVWVTYLILVLLGFLLGGRGRRMAGLGLTLAALAAAVVLAFPLALELVRRGGEQTVRVGAAMDFLSLLRLAPGEAPGSWLPAVFLPVAGVFAFALAGDPDRRLAWRAALAASTALPLAWLAAAGYLPGVAADPVAYLGLAAASLSILIGLAFRALLQGVGLEVFGLRHLAFGGLAVLVAAGVALQAGQALRGNWAVGEDRIPPAYPVVQTANPGYSFRVLWIGGIGGRAFPAPGGRPEGTVEAREASVRYAVTGRSGRSILSIALPATGPGYDYLVRSLRAVLAGDVRHGGALLAPLGVAFVVAGQGDLPEAAEERLDAQLDLLPARRVGGLVLYANARFLPVAGVLPNAEPEGDVTATDVLAPARVSRVGVQPLERAGAAAWEGRVDLPSAAPLLVSAEFDPRWRLVAEGVSVAPPFRAFGWAVGFEVPAGVREVRAELEGHWARGAQVSALAVLWAAAVWVVGRRRPEEP